MTRAWPADKKNHGWGVPYWREAQRTPWTVQLAYWDREAKAAECVEIVRLYRQRMDVLTQALRSTTTGAVMTKRKRTAAMNARYVYRDGKRVYVGKRKTDARKAKRAAAARERRTREWDKRHGVDLATCTLISQ